MNCILDGNYYLEWLDWLQFSDEYTPNLEHWERSFADEDAFLCLLHGALESELFYDDDRAV